MSEIEPRNVAGLEVLAALERSGAATATSLVLPADMPYERYEALMRALGHAHKTLTWMLADALNFGEHVYGQKYAQAADATGLRPETLMNYASIGRRVPAERRRPELSFGAHAPVAPLTAKEQERWLDKAVKHQWRREDLRERLHPRPALVAPNAGVIELEEAARDLVHSARIMGDGFLVQRLPFTQLCVALGEEA